jgi:hypothetical protein
MCVLQCSLPPTPNCSCILDECVYYSVAYLPPPHPKVVFIIPLPRYVLAGCCKNTDGVTNRLSGVLAAEFASAKKCLNEVAAMGERTGKARLINLLSFFGSGESPPQDLTTVDGASIWAGST